jgi:hypothetical protein
MLPQHLAGSGRHGLGECRAGPQPFASAVCLRFSKPGPCRSLPRRKRSSGNRQCGQGGQGGAWACWAWACWAWATLGHRSPQLFAVILPSQQYSSLAERAIFNKMLPPWPGRVPNSVTTTRPALFSPSLTVVAVGWSPTVRLTRFANMACAFAKLDHRASSPSSTSSTGVTANTSLSSSLSLLLFAAIDQRGDYLVTHGQAHEVANLAWSWATLGHDAAPVLFLPQWINARTGSCTRSVTKPWPIRC